jgi:DNA-binding transcriptional regulator YdaS (Cro superfamily)
MIKEISTKKLAKCMGTTSGFASQIKSGYRKMPTRYCIKVSNEFGIPLHELRPDVYPVMTYLVERRRADRRERVTITDS